MNKQQETAAERGKASNRRRAGQGKKPPQSGARQETSNLSGKSRLSFKREFSAGGAVFKNDKGQTLWLLGKHSGYRKWVLPKGLIEKGERGVETAVREVEEEAGVKAKIRGDKPIYKEEYWFVAEYKEENPRLSGLSHQSRSARDDKLAMKSLASLSSAGGQATPQVSSAGGQAIRRVSVYQENPEFEETKNKIRIFKTVSFYLMEYAGGDPAEHGWEMSEAGWFDYQEALNKLAFKGEKEALRLANDKIQSGLS